MRRQGPESRLQILAALCRRQGGADRLRLESPLRQWWQNLHGLPQKLIRQHDRQGLALTGYRHRPAQGVVTVRNGEGRHHHMGGIAMEAVRQLMDGAIFF